MRNLLKKGGGFFFVFGHQKVLGVCGGIPFVSRGREGSLVGVCITNGRGGVLEGGGGSGHNGPLLRAIHM